MNKTALFLYNMIWGLIVPGLKLNKRLAEGYAQRTLQETSLSRADLWIQAASAGESYLAWSILKELKPCRPVSIMLTTTTSQGMDILNRAVDDISPNKRGISAHVAYFPFDRPDIMKKAVAMVQPGIMVLLELEMWPGLLAALKKFGCKTLLINGRLTEKSLKGYLALPGLWRSLQPDKILAISQDDATRFAALFEKERVDVMHNIKFDRLDSTGLTAASHNPIRNVLPSDRQFVVLGSVRQEEEKQVEKIISHIRNRQPDAVIGLFPRHMHRIKHWEKFLAGSKTPWLHRSKIESEIAPGTLILWDTFGELAPAYKLARAAFVGGTLAPPLGGQNFLEPLICGILPVIGPFWKHFYWVGHDIVSQRLVRVADSWKTVVDILVADLKNPQSRDEVQQAAIQYVKARQGGTARGCNLINEFLGKI